MGIESVTDSKISELIQLPKRVTNGNAREKIEGKHSRKDYKATTSDNTLHFSIFVRQNQIVADDFSVGLLWHMPSGESLMLRRYNGPAHAHGNKLENTNLSYVCHIHLATERYITLGKKTEGYAEETDRYNTVRGALHCLLIDCNISGVESEADQPRLPL